MRMQEPQIQLIENHPESQGTIGSLWYILKKKWWLIPPCIVITISFAYYLTKSPGFYKATAVVRSPTASTFRIDRNSALSRLLGSQAYGSLSTEVEIIKGRELAGRVIEKLGYAKRSETPEQQWRMMILGLQARLQIERKTMTSLIEITASSMSPKEATDIANAVATEYIELYKRFKEGTWRNLIDQMDIELQTVKADLVASRKRLYDYAEREGLTTAYASLLGETQYYGVSDSPQNAINLKSNIEAMELELEVKKKSLGNANPGVVILEDKIAVSKLRLEQVKKEADESYDKQFDLTNVAAEVMFNRQLYTILMSRQQELKAQYLMQLQQPELVENAWEPLWPSKPNRRPVLLMSAFVGLIAGLGLALIIEYMDNSIHTTEDMARFTGLPVLGKIPRLGKGRKIPKGNALITYNGVKSTRKSWIMESYRQSYRAFQLKVMATFNGNGRGILPEYSEKTENNKPQGLTMLVTSSVPNEGASLVAANLAISISQIGRKVLLVDTDYRYPTQHKLLGLDARAGLADMLTGEITWDQVVSKSSIDNLSVIVSGWEGKQFDLSAVLSSNEMIDFINWAREKFDVIIFDSPPAVLASESLAISSKVSGVVLVVRANTTEKDVVLQAKETIQDSGGNIVGTVLTFAADGEKSYRNYFRK